MVIDNGGDGSKCICFGKIHANKHLDHKLDSTLEIVGTIVDIQSLCNFVKKIGKLALHNFHVQK